MRGDEFRIYDPFARQRKKRTGTASDFGILYQQGIDKPMIAKIVEAARRTERGKYDYDEVGVEERAERIDALARADATNATYGDKPFAPRDFAAKRGIDLSELGRKENKRHPLLWALHGTEERTYQQANDAFGQRDYEELMAIPERRKVPRGNGIGIGIGKPGDEIIIGDLGPGGPVKALPEGGIRRPFPMPTKEPRKDVRRQFHPIPINDPPADGGEQSPEGGNDVAPLPGRIRFPVQPVEDIGTDPIPGGPPYEHPEFGRGYPFPQPVTAPRDAAAVEETPEADASIGPAERALLIDQLIGAIETGQISIDAVKKLAAPDQANKLAVQDINAFASAEEESFAGDGLNQFTAIDTDPRAGPSALRPDPPKSDSPPQPEDDSEKTDRGDDLYKTAAGPRGYHESPYGTDYNTEPGYDLEGWDGTEWHDDIPFFTDGVRRKLSSRYGWRYLDEDRPKDFHAGIDIAADAGSLVVSAHAGTIIKIFNKNGEFGVVIRSDDGKLYTYYHINPVEFMARGRKLVKDKRVEIGDSLGRVRDRKEKGSYLHFACHDPEVPKNPDIEIWKLRSDANSCDPLNKRPFG